MERGDGTAAIELALGNGAAAVEVIGRRSGPRLLPHPRAIGVITHGERAEEDAIKVSAIGACK